MYYMGLEATKPILRGFKVLGVWTAINAETSADVLRLKSHCEVIPTKRVSNQSPQLQRLARILKFHM